MDNTDCLHQSYRVLVIAGGDSAERSVSLDSGTSVATALREAGHVVDLWDPSEHPISHLPADNWEAAFPMLHGTGGEDGSLQRQLESIDLPWVGSSQQASALTFNKARTREHLAANSLPVAAGRELHTESESTADRFPVVIKPSSQGSSVGITMVRNENEWTSAVRHALSLSKSAVEEEFVAGREFSVPILNGESLPAVEIVVADGWYDYANKYESNTTQYRVQPDDTPPELAELACRACQVCETSGIVRVDFRINSNGNVFILELNTIPGMTSHSLVPMSAAAAGISLSELCDLCIRDLMDS